MTNPEPHPRTGLHHAVARQHRTHTAMIEAAATLQADLAAEAQEATDAMNQGGQHGSSTHPPSGE